MLNLEIRLVSDQGALRVIELDIGEALTKPQHLTSRSDLNNYCSPRSSFLHVSFKL